MRLGVGFHASHRMSAPLVLPDPGGSLGWRLRPLVRLRNASEGNAVRMYAIGPALIDDP